MEELQEPDEELLLDTDALDAFLPTPSITSIPKHQNQPLQWHHRVQLIGEKCPNARIHVCDSCRQPILVYGRLVSVSRACHSPAMPSLTRCAL